MSAPVDPAVLAAARTVRTSDVSDALDSMGLQDSYVMDPAMRPLYLRIRFAGIAHTMAYELTDRRLEPMA